MSAILDEVPLMRMLECSGFSSRARVMVFSIFLSRRNKMADAENKFSFITEGEHELILGNSLNHNAKEQEYAFHTIRCEYENQILGNGKFILLSGRSSICSWLIAAAYFTCFSPNSVLFSSYRNKAMVPYVLYTYT